MTPQIKFIKGVINDLAKAYRKYTGLDGAYDKEMNDADKALEAISEIEHLVVNIEELEWNNSVLCNRIESMQAELDAIKEERDTAIKAFRTLILKEADARKTD